MFMPPLLCTGLQGLILEPEDPQYLVFTLPVAHSLTSLTLLSIITSIALSIGRTNGFCKF